MKYLLLIISAEATADEMPSEQEQKAISGEYLVISGEPGSKVVPSKSDRLQQPRCG